MLRELIRGRWIVGLCLLLAFLQLTCDRKKPLSNLLATGQVEVRVVWPVAKSARVEYDSLVVMVSGGEMAPVRRVFAVEGRRAAWRIGQVPVGRRTVELEVFGRKEGSGRAQRLYQSEGEVTVLKEQTQSITLTLEPMAVEVNGGVLSMSADTVMVGDTLRVEVREASSSHSRPLFRWGWGDGQSAAWGYLESSWHVYAGTGTYTLRASVCDSIAQDQVQEQTAQVVVVARNLPPEAVAASNAPVSVDSTLALDGSGSTDPEGRALGFAWTLVSGPTEIPIDAPDQALISLRPQEEGTYRFQLVVRDGQGLADTTEVAVAVTPRINHPPVAVAGVDVQVLVGSQVVLDGSGSADADGDALTFSWTQIGGPSVPLTGTEQASFTAVEEGMYLFQLIVKDGEVDSEPDTVEVESLALFAQVGTEVGADTLGVRLVDGRVRLDGSRSQPQERGLTYYWEQIREDERLRPEFRGLMARFVDVSVMGTVPDNESRSADRVSFDPSEGRGLYVFTLRVGLETPQGELHSAADTVYVFVRSAPPVVEGVDAPDTVEVSQVVTLTVQTSNDLEEELVFRWRGEHAGLLSDTTSAAPQFSSEVPGTYRFVAVAIDADPQESAPFEVLLVVEPDNRLPVVTITTPTDSSLLRAGRDIVLQGKGEDPEDGELAASALVWSSDVDGVLGEGLLVTRDDLSIGPHLITLTGTDSDGELGTAAVQVEVRENTVPVADAGEDREVFVDATVDLDGRGSADADGDSLRYRWRAPEGVALNDSTDVQPQFVAGEAGEYRFTLMVSDGEVNSDPNEVVITVVERPPVADFAADVTEGEMPLIVHFTDASGGKITGRHWDFGDGIMSTEANPSHYFMVPATYDVALTVSGPGGSARKHSTVTVVPPPEATDELFVDRFPVHAPGLLDTVMSETALIVFRLAETADTVGIAYRGLDGPDAGRIRWRRLVGSQLVYTDTWQLFEIDSLQTGTTYALHLFGIGLSGTRYYAGPDTLVYDESYIVPLIKRFAVTPVRDLSGDDTEVTLRITAMASVDDRWIAYTYYGEVVLRVDDADARFEGLEITDLGGGRARANADGWYLGSREVTIKNLSPWSTVTVYDSLDVIGPYVGSWIFTQEDNWPPVADAGPDQSVETGTRVTLDGSASTDADGDPLRYTWTEDSGNPATALLSDPAAERPVFTPPIAGVYQFTLTVSDGQAKDIDEVAVQVAAGPVLAVEPDTLDFGTVTIGDSRSLEVAVRNAGSGRLEVSEVELDAPFGVGSLTLPQEVKDDGSIRVSFRPEKGGRVGVEFTLRSNGGEQSVWLRGRGNVLPVADAGEDREVFVEEAVSLDGSGSVDADGDSLRYRWRAPEGVALHDTTAVRPQFTAGIAGEYRITLVVNDREVDSASDEVVVKVVEKPPVADFAADITEGEMPLMVTFTDLSSGKISSRQWDFGDGATSDDTHPTHGFMLPGTYTVELTVTGPGGSDAKQSTINVVVPFGATDELFVRRFPVHVPGMIDTVNRETAYVSFQLAEPADTVGITYYGLSGPDAGRARTRRLVGSELSRTNLQIFSIDSLHSGTTYALSIFGVDLSGGKYYAGPDMLVYDDSYVVPVIQHFHIASVEEDLSGDETELTLRITALASMEGRGTAYTHYNEAIIQSPDGEDVEFAGEGITFLGNSRAVASADHWYLGSREVQVRNLTPGVTITVVDSVSSGGPYWGTWKYGEKVNRPPVADAGEDQTVSVGSTVTLDGSGSTDADGDALLYAWEQVRGSQVSLNGQESASPSFVAGEEGSYTFALTVSDGTDSASDTVAVVVEAVPVLAVEPDTLDFGTVEVGQTRSLELTLVNDGNAALQVNEVSVEAPFSVVSQSLSVVAGGSRSLNVVFAPTGGGAFSSALRVRSNGGEVSVWLVGRGNASPVAQLTANPSSGTLATSFVLDASGSSDPEGTALQFRWDWEGDGTWDTGYYSLPQVIHQFASKGKKTVVVEARDQEGLRDTAAVEVTVENRLPVAGAGADRTVEVGTTVTLDGSESRDADGDGLTYLWKQVGGSPITLANASTVAPRFTPAKAGIYRFSLIVNDGMADSPSAEVAIVAKPSAPTGMAATDGTLRNQVKVTWEEVASAESYLLFRHSHADTSQAELLTTVTGTSFEDTSATPGVTYYYWVQTVEGELVSDLSRSDSGFRKENTAPVADAGDDQTMDAGARVMLDGSGSRDADGDALTYAWKEDSGNPATGLLSDASAEQPTFTPSLAGTYGFVLVVNDGELASRADTVMMTISRPLVFADANLEAAVREAIGKPSGDILASDVAGLDSLNARGQDITDLGGIENLTGLRYLDLNRTQVSDVSALSSLTQLWYLDLIDTQVGDLSALSSLIQLTVLHLSGPQVSDVSALSSLTQLRLLDMTLAQVSDVSVLSSLTQLRNLNLTLAQVSDVSVLSSLTQLTTLNLFGTQVSDVSALSSLTQLTLLILSNTQVSDITPLVDNSGLGSGDSVYLTGAPLNADAYSTHIPALEARGVKVVFDEPTNSAPTADAGTDQTVDVGTTVTLDGSRSRDADGDGLSYQWNGPAEIVLSNTSVSRPTFVASTAGTYRFTLVVNDGKVDSEPDEVVIRVTTPVGVESVLVSIPDIEARAGDQVLIPVQISGLRGQEIITGEVKVKFDPSVLAGQDIVKLGSLTDGWLTADQIDSSATDYHVFQVVFAASRGFSEDGDLFYMEFMVNSDVEPGTTTILEVIVASFNNGEPQARLGSGTFRVQLSVVEVQPEITVDLPGGATMEMVWIEPGTFIMGSPDSDGMANDYEKPQHQVTITKGYYLGKYEVTQAQWESVMGTRPWSRLDYVQSNPDNPAVYVTWNDAQEYIAKLNTAAGRNMYRLPTEAEWEYACRAGTTTRWSFGDDESQLGEYAWYLNNAWSVGKQYAQPVGTKLPNPWGLYDMHGNVLEWCQDWHGSYSSSAQTDPTGSSWGSNRVRRGGDFVVNARSTRSAVRSGGSTGASSDGVGFRLLRIQ